jgi:signal transduction histidine kinase
MEVTVSADGVSDDLPDEHKTCVYRVVQEALHNSTSHAAASNVRIRVQQEARRLTLSIQDDGRGFNTEQVKGLGLLGMQERVARLGGTCRVHSYPGNGTAISVDLPLEPESEKTREADTDLARR